ncbi:hypothetical protein O6H91_23G060700 [Diphasiastrum complanatum]|uniref:Uncharacterized protein n=1 Tax=Diphasiastrum complanatum TaxID=34168 RepID=A0ACC2AB48_DIPCM|nr:hypothetical protein O6H91_23G060700 [Diphasiastrum complanatum]
MAEGVLCENCESEALEWCEEADGGEGGYICPLWKNHEPGVGCDRVVTVQEFKERRKSVAVSESTLETDEIVENVEGQKHEDNVRSKDGETKAKNIAALLRGDLIVKRQALLPKVLTVSEGAAVIRRPFKSPCPGNHSGRTPELLRRLSVRKRFVPWGSSRQFFLPPHNTLPTYTDLLNQDFEEESETLPPDIEPLVLWQPEDVDPSSTQNAESIVVDPILVRFLRPHQREGVQFMFECIAGLRDFSKVDESLAGCILADDMGLGKTLQSITLVWTVLRQGFDGSPLAKRVIIVTPTSLVSNWESEIKKWLGGRVNLIAICESTRAEVISDITSFLAPRTSFQVLIISYETFRMHATKFQKEGSCDLLICDEAHRLKNDQTLTNQALAGLHCRRRVLLSGTPMQNDLEEFFAMVNFTNPGILGDATAFRRYYEHPILYGREPDASDEERALGAERSAELSEKVNQFILRRTNALLSNHLPPKIVEVVCCKLTDLQLKMYRHFIDSKNVRLALEDKSKRSRALASITALKKLCNHPKLIYDTLRAGGSEAAGFEECMQFFPQEMFSGRTGSWACADGSWIHLSGKMLVLAQLLANLRQNTDDRIVLVSNYTQTLDLFAQICRERNYPYLRLDGTTSIGKRQKLVQRFNDPTLNEFAFLLSSKAGGCGLNLIGGNRLVLFDPDWNPATDKQAAARVWRDGQKKRVFIYRFLATGTIEEKVYQRQLSKEGLQKVVDKEQTNDPRAQVNVLSMEDLRDLFTLHEDVRSDTHESLGCKRCKKNKDEELEVLDSGSDSDGEFECKGTATHPSKTEVNELSDIGRFSEVAGCLTKQHSWEKQVGTPTEEDLRNWAHHASPSTVPDTILQLAAGDEVSFVFTCQIDGKLTPVDSAAPKLHSFERNIRGNQTYIKDQQRNGSVQVRGIPIMVARKQSTFKIAQLEGAARQMVDTSTKENIDSGPTSMHAVGKRTPRKGRPLNNLLPEFSENRIQDLETSSKSKSNEFVKRIQHVDTSAPKSSTVAPKSNKSFNSKVSEKVRSVKLPTKRTLPTFNSSSDDDDFA